MNTFRAPGLALVVTALLVGIWFAAGLRTVAAQETPLSVIEAGGVAVNAGDVDAWMDLWADGAVWKTDACYPIIGPDGCTGKEAIRAVASVFIEDSLVWTWPEGLQVSGNTVRGRGQGSWGALAPLGIERVLFNTQWKVVDGKMTYGHFEINFADADSVKWRNALYPALGAEVPTDPRSVLEVATFTVNAGDTDGFTAFWADDGVWETDACYIIISPDGCKGTDEIRAVGALFIEDSFSWTWTTDLQVSGITVSGSAELRVGALAALDIERVLFDVSWDVVGGKFTFAHFDVDVSDADSDKWLTALYASAEVEPPDTGGAGLVATNRDGGRAAWPFMAGVALLVLALSAWLFSVRRSAA